jgi:hypothetical protein
MLTLEAKRFGPKLTGFRGCAFRQSTVETMLASRTIHNGFWHESAWL